jgi:hypothetical protein
MKDMLLKMVISMIISYLTPTVIADLKAKGILLYQISTDNQIDTLEDYIKNTPTKVDDAILPLVTILRGVINVPDNDPIL